MPSMAFRFKKLSDIIYGKLFLRQEKRRKNIILVNLKYYLYIYFICYEILIIKTYGLVRVFKIVYC